MKKYRADELLCLRGHCSGKEEAARLIMAGKVRTSPDAVVQKGSQMLPEDTPLLVDSGCPYVSRGALKLKDALEKFAPDLTNCICGDVGASTGGFTDLMLSKNAANVYAVDVGKDLLHWKLRTDDAELCARVRRYAFSLNVVTSMPNHSWSQLNVEPAYAFLDAINVPSSPA